MIRLSRLTDYGIVLMSHMASRPDAVHTAADVAAEAHLPVPTTSKLLKSLARDGFLVSHRGIRGGYSLARRPEEISIGDVITALEGPIGLTLCSLGATSDCQHQSMCPTRRPWQRINQVILEALRETTLAEMTPHSSRPLPLLPPAKSAAALR